MLKGGGGLHGFVGECRGDQSSPTGFEVKIDCQLTAVWGGGGHKNITEPYGGIDKFYRDITKILPPPPPPLFHVINIELSLNNPGVYRIGRP